MSDSLDQVIVYILALKLLSQHLNINIGQVVTSTQKPFDPCTCFSCFSSRVYVYMGRSWTSRALCQHKVHVASDA